MSSGLTFLISTVAVLPAIFKIPTFAKPTGTPGRPPVVMRNFPSLSVNPFAIWPFSLIIVTVAPERGFPLKSTVPVTGASVNVSEEPQPHKLVITSSDKNLEKCTPEISAK
jgi:hypothetical protein